MSNSISNINSLVFYGALLSNAEQEVNYIIAHPDMPGHESLLKQFTDLVISHKKNVERLEKQIQAGPAVVTQLETILQLLNEMYAVVKYWIPEDVKKFIEALIKAAEILIKKYK